MNNASGFWQGEMRMAVIRLSKWANISTTAVRKLQCSGSGARKWGVAGLVFLLGISLPAAAEPVRTVLMVYGESRLSPAITVGDENIRAAAQEGSGQSVEFLTEFLDVGRFADAGYEALLTDFLRGKYQGKHIDVVVAGGPSALRFLLRHRAELLPDTPVVHAAVTSAQLKALSPPPDVVGVPIDPDPLPTLELALRLHPQARRLTLITGTSAWDLDVEKQLRAVIPRLPAQVHVEFLAGLPMAGLKGRLSLLSNDTLVFIGSFQRDGAGRSFVNADAIAQIASASAVPVYGSYSSYVGAGIVGGYMSTFEAMGWQAGDIARRLLNGEQASALGLPTVHRNAYLFDWQQLQRFGIDENALPQGSVVKYRQPSFWEAYRGRIVAAIIVVLLQAALIALLLVERRLRRQTAAELLDSEKRMNLAANAAGLGMWLWNIGCDEIWATPHARALYGVGASESIDFDRFLSTLHATDQEAMKKAVETALVSIADFETQYRVIHPDGELRWMLVKGQVESDEAGQPTAIVGVSIDITSRKLAELAAEQHRNEMVRMARVGLVGQLSGSIAHELNQPLSAILANTQAAQRLLAREPVDWQEIGEILKDIVEDDQRAVEVIQRLRLLFNRGESQRQPLHTNELVRDALKLAHNDIVTEQVSLSTELADDLPSVVADWVQLQQVLLNLIVNACEAMAEKETTMRKLTVRTWRDGGEVIIEVADTGKGVDADVEARLFESFFTTKTNSMGMGLAISRTIIEAHGGRLALANNSERGAEFRISLPIIKEGVDR
ncbi:MAG: ATP-binding protein [Methylobacter sp.]|nr:ATP-binding protein [Methylobacter sp.]